MGSVSMDFVGGLPISMKGRDYLNVAMARFSKMYILMPCKKQVIAEQIASLFLQHVWVHFGLPTSIVSDRDFRFLGEFWTSLWRMMDTKMKRSMEFHTQIDGKTKVINHIMVHLLRGYCGKHPKLWDEQLPYVQHAYNQETHSSTQSSLFETCFGYQPRDPLNMVFGKYEDGNGRDGKDKAQKFI